jgi:hypothetical protein
LLPGLLVGRGFFVDLGLAVLWTGAGVFCELTRVRVGAKTNGEAVAFDTAVS